MTKKTIEIQKDVLGFAYMAYLQGDTDAYFTLYSTNFEPDDIPVSVFFRTFDEMPKLEQQAIIESKGKILDVGAGTGTHSLELQKRGFNVTALDISELAVEVMKQRGVKNAVCADFFTFSEGTYDTILFLMNGIGLIQKLENFPSFFSKVSELLSPQGQIILDSSDLCYLYENEDGSFDIPLHGNYYGQVDFKVEFQNQISKKFYWVYVDYNTLQHEAENAGFTCDFLADGGHYDYVAKLKKKIPIT